MKKKICVVTATRAEYGLLKPVMDKLSLDEEIVLQIVATGMHLSTEFGLTYKEIEGDGFVIDEKVEIQMSSESPVGISKTMGMAMIGFSDVFVRLKPDMIVLLGDRYETFAVAGVATVHNIPIAHLYGGETTEGAFDEAFRHAITKMSYLHFTSTEEYRKRIIQLGEAPERVFNVGALGVENINNTKLFDKTELEKDLQFKFGNRAALVTFHPTTLDNQPVEEQFKKLVLALDKFKDLNIIFTGANSDVGGGSINRLIDEYVENRSKNIKYFVSLGVKRYLSTLKYVDLVIGNSSSGLVEVPSFHIPTVNIGDRQRGRIRGKTVIDCDAETEEIVKAMDKGLSNQFKIDIQNERNPYEGKNPSIDVINIIKIALNSGGVDLKKKFYDVKFCL